MKRWLTSIFLVMLGVYTFWRDGWVMILIVTIGGGLMFGEFVTMVERLRPLRNHYSFKYLLLNLSGMLYIGLPLYLVVQLRLHPEGIAWILFLVLIVSFNDTAAYFGGKICRRYITVHPLSSVSPGKTIEGSVIGLLAGALMPLVVEQIWWTPSVLRVNLSPSIIFSIGCVTAASAQVGDLLESFIKRKCFVKDSGTLLPGHGGFLDRFDGYLLAVIPFYLFRQLFG